MKKLIALLLALVMVFSVAAVFAGCEGDIKKSSKSEDEEEKNEDETTAPEGGETTAPEGGETTAPEVDEPTDPEPTDPEPTEDVVTGELMDELDIAFDENIKTLALLCAVYEDGVEMVVEVDVQELNDSEMLIGYVTEEVDVILHVTADGAMKLYSLDESAGMYVEDASADATTMQTIFSSAYYISCMFTDLSEILGENAKYEKLEVQDIEDIGEVALYNVYMNEELIYTIYVEVATGIILNIEDANGECVGCVVETLQDFDLTTMIAQ